MIRRISLRCGPLLPAKWRQLGQLRIRPRPLCGPIFQKKSSMMTGSGPTTNEVCQYWVYFSKVIFHCPRSKTSWHPQWGAPSWGGYNCILDMSQKWVSGFPNSDGDQWSQKDSWMPLLIVIIIQYVIWGTHLYTQKLSAVNLTKHRIRHVRDLLAHCLVAGIELGKGPVTSCSLPLLSTNEFADHWIRGKDALVVTWGF